MKMPARAKTGQEAGCWLAGELLQSPPTQREISSNSICQAWLGKEFLCLTFNNPGSFHVCQVLNRASRGCRVVDASPPLSANPPSPLIFDLYFWPLGSRKEEALNFSIAGFVSYIVCVFPIVCLTEFLTEVKDVVEALIRCLHIPAHHLVSLYRCVCFYYESFSRQ